MSKKISLSSLSNEDVDTINRELIVTQEPSKYAFSAEPKYIYLFEAEGDDLFVPFSYGKKYPRPPRTNFPERKINFQGVLRENQKPVKKEAIEKLNQNGSVIIAAGCGFGKTSLGIYIATKICLPTLIICHRIVLINQWKESIKKFCPDAEVQVLNPGTVKKHADFYICNAINIAKNPREYYSDIGFIIVDEAHLIMADKLSYCMRYLLPRYVLGLSATPYRTDGLDVLLDMYFGTDKIVRKLFRRHIVYRYNTGLKPEVRLNRMGKVDWGSVLESQCLNKERNEIIIRIIKYFPERIFLVLCKRVDQANYLVARLTEEKEDVTSLIGSNQEFCYTSRILVGTVQKTGVGFDHARLDSLIIASDLEQYFVQYLGRVFRREDNDPIIFDLVDDYPLLKKHFQTRFSVYAEHGGIVKDFHKEFNNFR
jgi:superfamily II DNA or RNA helicase